MVVVAHQDDDIMVSIPDLLPSITAGAPIQTVYLTSGDAGFTCNKYTHDRELGAKAGQAKLAGVANRWVDQERIVRGKRVRFSQLVDTNISMAFVGLPNPSFLSANPPDGAMMKLWKRQVTSVNTLPFDGRSGIDTYTREDLIEELRTLMGDFNASDLRVLDASQLQLSIYPFEHVDHQASAMFATAAFQRYARADSITFYPLYSVIFENKNLSAADTALRSQIFDTYRAFDPKICTNLTTNICGGLTTCDPLGIYNDFWPRSYPADTLRGAGKQLQTPTGFCFEAVGTSLRTRFCDSGRAAQRFTLQRGGAIRSDATGQCLSVTSSASGQTVSLRSCVREPNQQFYLTTQKQLRGPDATCVCESGGQGALAECSVDVFQVGYRLR
jgi:LmbE family N-acetylglucosaminyl deacetylase